MPIINDHFEVVLVCSPQQRNLVRQGIDRGPGESLEINDQFELLRDLGEHLQISRGDVDTLFVLVLQHTPVPRFWFTLPEALNLKVVQWAGNDLHAACTDTVCEFKNGCGRPKSRTGHRHRGARRSRPCRSHKWEVRRGPL